MSEARKEQRTTATHRTGHALLGQAHDGIGRAGVRHNVAVARVLANQVLPAQIERRLRARRLGLVLLRALLLVKDGTGVAPEEAGLELALLLADRIVVLVDGSAAKPTSHQNSGPFPRRNRALTLSGSRTVVWWHRRRPTCRVRA